MKRKSCTVIPPRQVALVPTTRHLRLVDLLVDTRTELLELTVRSGLKVLEAMMEEDRVALCGVRYAHESQQPAPRAGTVASAVGHEVALPTFQAMAHTDPLNRRIVEQMLVGVTTRQYARSLDPIGDALTSRGTSKSAVSRRFVVQTAAQLEKWRWGLMPRARNTYWACGTARRKTRRSVRACWRICSSAAFGRTAAC
jgi:hypothetical protein